uniref:ER membrane protein complex subunit 1 n=1 Tax=Picocystis salinarum TaxID=88271 RepID=A0A7S3UEK2_9CHLO
MARRKRRVCFHGFAALLWILLIGVAAQPEWQEARRLQQMAVQAAEEALELQRKALDVMQKAQPEWKSNAKEAIEKVQFDASVLKKKDAVESERKRPLQTRIVAKKGSAWEDSFDMQAMVQLESDATAIAMWPRKEKRGLSKYVASSDTAGNVYVFDGDGNTVDEWKEDSVLVHDPTGSSTKRPKTKTLVFLERYKTKGMALVAGLEDGTMRVFDAQETRTKHPENRRRYLYNFQLVPQRKLLPPKNVIGIAKVSTCIQGSSSRIMGIDGAGTISLFNFDTGMFEGTARAPGRVVDVYGKATPLLFLENGIAKFDPQLLEVQFFTCEGLNGSTIVATQQDSQASARFYAVTSEMEILTIYATAKSRGREVCRVRARVPADLSNAGELKGMSTVKNYLLILGSRSISLFNTTLTKRGKYHVTPVLEAKIDGIGEQLGIDGSKHAIVAANGNADQGLAVALQGGYLINYRSVLPQPPKYKDKKRFLLLGQPIIIIGMAAFVLYQYRSKRKKYMSDFEQQERMAELFGQMKNMQSPDTSSPVHEGPSFTKETEASKEHVGSFQSRGKASDAKYDASDRARLMEKLSSLRSEHNSTPFPPFWSASEKKDM